MLEYQRRNLIAEILIGIRVMHQKFICHRDIKPENILLNERNRVKICDFGEAKVFDQGALVELAQFYLNPDHMSILKDKKLMQQSLLGSQGPNASGISDKNSENSFFSMMFTFSEKLGSNKQAQQSIRKRQRGTFVGTRDFLSPEMVGEYSISGPFTDLWALGIICYQLYTGKTPWVSKQNDEILDEIASTHTVTFPEDVPPPAVELMQILLKRNPAERMGLTRQNVNDGDWYSYQHLFDLDFFSEVKVSDLEIDEDLQYL